SERDSLKAKTCGRLFGITAATITAGRTVAGLSGVAGRTAHFLEGAGCAFGEGLLQHGQQVLRPIGQAATAWGEEGWVAAPIGHPQNAHPIEDWAMSATRAIIRRTAGFIFTRFCKLRLRRTLTYIFDYASDFDCAGVAIIASGNWRTGLLIPKGRSPT